VAKTASISSRPVLALNSFCTVRVKVQVSESLRVSLTKVGKPISQLDTSL